MGISIFNKGTRKLNLFGILWKINKIEKHNLFGFCLAKEIEYPISLSILFYIFDLVKK